MLKILWRILNLIFFEMLLSQVKVFVEGKISHKFMVSNKKKKEWNQISFTRAYHSRKRKIFLSMSNCAENWCEKTNGKNVIRELFPSSRAYNKIYEIIIDSSRKGKEMFKFVWEQKKKKFAAAGRYFIEKEQQNFELM